jgi:4-amino-4-deoxy-L-arabinose transferase-like glycosyltransferase
LREDTPAAPEPRARPRFSLLRPFFYVFFFSLVIRVLWTAHATITPIGDHFGYDRSARHWIDTGEFASAVPDRYYRIKGTGRLDVRAYRTPGYIGFLALLYMVDHNWGLAAAAQAFLGALASGLLVVLAARTLSRRVGIVAGVLHAIWPTAIVYVPVIAGDNLLVFLLVAGLTCLTGAHTGRWRWWLATGAGLCFGLMMLTRPSSLFLFPGYALLCLYNPLQRVWRPRVLLLLIALTGAIMTPWLVRNALLGYGFPLFSTQGGYALWWGNNWLTSDGGNPAPPRFPGDSWMPELKQHHFFQQKALDWIRSDPGRYLALSAVRLVRLFGTQPDVWAAKYYWPSAQNDRLMCATYWKEEYPPADVKAGRALENRNRLWEQRARVVVAPVMLLAVLLAMTRPRRFAFVLLPLWSYAICLALTVFAGRYRVTSDPLVFVCLAALLVDLWSGTRETGRWVHRWVKLALVVLAVTGSVWAHAEEWDRDWYRLPAGRAPQPDFDPNAPRLVTLDARFPERIKTLNSGGCETALSAEDDTLRADLRAAADGANPHGGVRLPVAGVSALRFRASFEQPENVDTFLVTALDAEHETRLRWSWRVGRHCPLPPLERPETFVLVPSEPSAFFVAEVEDPDADWTRSARAPEDRLARAQEVGQLIEELRFVVRVKRGTQTTLRLHELTVSQTPTVAAPAQAQGNWLERDLTRRGALVGFAGGSGDVQLTDSPLGVHIDLSGTVAESVPFGGVRVRVEDPVAARLQLSLGEVDDVEAILVSGLDAERVTRWRWEWRLGTQPWRLPPDQRLDVVLLPGRGTGEFVWRAADTGAPIRDLRLALRLRPGGSARVILHNLAIAARPPQLDECWERATQVDLRSPEITALSSRDCDVRLAADAGGLRCTLQGIGGSKGQPYGAVCIPVADAARVRLRVALDRPENVDAIMVSGVDAQRKQRLRWEYPLSNRPWRPAADRVQEWLLVPGESQSDFVAKVSDTSVPVTQLRLILRIKPGTAAECTLHGVEVAAP